MAGGEFVFFVIRWLRHFGNPKVSATRAGGDTPCSGDIYVAIIRDLQVTGNGNLKVSAT